MHMPKMKMDALRTTVDILCTLLDSILKLEPIKRPRIGSAAHASIRLTVNEPYVPHWVAWVQSLFRRKVINEKYRKIRSL